jgi:hypothetical protein
MTLKYSSEFHITCLGTMTAAEAAVPATMAVRTEESILKKLGVCGSVYGKDGVLENGRRRRRARISRSGFIDLAKPEILHYLIR